MAENYKEFSKGVLVGQPAYDPHQFSWVGNLHFHSSIHGCGQKKQYPVQCSAMLAHIERRGYTVSWIWHLAHVFRYALHCIAWLISNMKLPLSIMQLFSATLSSKNRFSKAVWFFFHPKITLYLGLQKNITIHHILWYLFLWHTSYFILYFHFLEHSREDPTLCRATHFVLKFE